MARAALVTQPGRYRPLPEFLARTRKLLGAENTLKMLEFETTAVMLVHFCRIVLHIRLFIVIFASTLLANVSEISIFPASDTPVINY